MTMQIRRYQDSDRDQVLRLHKAALEAAGAYVGNGPWDDDLNDIKRSYLNARGEFLVGIADGQIAAMGGLRQIDECTAELRRMRVAIELQGQGLGRRILQTLEARARELGCSHLVLDTSHRQTAARALYQSEDYRQSGTGGLAGLPILFFRKSLAPGTIGSALVDTVDDRPGIAISG